MSERNHDLESELTSMRPTSPSEALEHRIAESVASMQSHALPRQSFGRWWRLGLSVAAVVLLAVSLWLTMATVDRPDKPVPPIAGLDDRAIDHLPPATQSKSFSGDLPTMGSFRFALRRSSSEFDSLLDRHGQKPILTTRDVSIRQLSESNSS